MSEEDKDKQNKRTLKENDKIISTFIKNKAKRHVKEPQEPVFSEIMGEFEMNYAKSVVSKSSLEILKILKG